MNHKPQIIIDPLVNIYYASFYIEGLYELYGRCNVKFSSKPFVNLSFESRMGAFAFIIVKGSQEQKCIISLFDSYKIIDELYHWCDVYGSVNANFRLTPQEYHSKLVSLPPSFGIRLWSFFDTLYYACSNLLKVCIETKGAFNKRKFIGKYRRMYCLRLPYKAYKTKEVFNINHPYIFHLSTLWYNDEWNKNDEGVNKARANFIRACKQIQGIVFEGGMVSQGADKSSETLFNDCLYSNTVSMKAWMEKTKQSILVFNTPAFWNCHGWKLGEYLALGKAIISVSLFNDMPAPLIHGENIHFVENDENKIKEAIELIINNNEYRLKLEKGALAYWEKYGNIIQSLKLLNL